MSYDKAKQRIDRKWRDALEFIAIGASSDAERLQTEIAGMTFEDLIVPEVHRLQYYADRAVTAIGAAIDGVRKCKS
jgi:hypothetical protein